MKVRALVVALVAAAVAVSAAVAAPPPGKGKPATNPAGHTPGKPPTTGTACKPQVTVVLKGTITGLAGNITLQVTRANRWGQAWANAGTAAVTVNGDTKVRRNGQKALTDLAVMDWVLVQARVCKADLANNAMPTLVAVRVVAHPAKT